MAIPTKSTTHSERMVRAKSSTGPAGTGPPAFPSGSVNPDVGDRIETAQGPRVQIAVRPEMRP